jgi:hypothetical protein
VGVQGDEDGDDESGVPPRLGFSEAQGSFKTKALAMSRLTLKVNPSIIDNTTTTTTTATSGEQAPHTPPCPIALPISDP